MTKEWGDSRGRGVDESPDHGADLVEQVEGLYRLRGVDRGGVHQQLEMRVDLLRGRIRDASVMHPITPTSSMTLGQIRRHRRRRSYDLVCKRSVVCRNPTDYRDRRPGRLQRDVEYFETISVGGLVHAFLRGVHALLRVAGGSSVKGREATKPALDRRGLSH